MLIYDKIVCNLSFQKGALSYIVKVPVPVTTAGSAGTAIIVVGNIVVGVGERRHHAHTSPSVKIGRRHTEPGAQAAIATAATAAAHQRVHHAVAASAACL